MFKYSDQTSEVIFGDCQVLYSFTVTSLKKSCLQQSFFQNKFYLILGLTHFPKHFYFTFSLCRLPFPYKSFNFFFLCIFACFAFRHGNHPPKMGEGWRRRGKTINSFSGAFVWQRDFARFYKFHPFLELFRRRKKGKQSSGGASLLSRWADLWWPETSESRPLLRLQKKR